MQDIDERLVKYWDVRYSECYTVETLFLYNTTALKYLIRTGDVEILDTQEIYLSHPVNEPFSNIDTNLWQI